jgi:predicted CoA-binding protein
MHDAKPDPNSRAELRGRLTGPDEIAALLRGMRRIAVVGCSPKPWRDSHRVARYLIEVGYDVVPVNPAADEIFSRRVYPSVRDVPGPVDLVDIFRRSELVPPVVEDAIASGAKAVWMQDGVIHETAAEQAIAAGLTVVMDRCILRDHRAFVASGR